MDAVTIEEFREALPPGMRKSVTPEVENQIRQKLADPDLYESYRESLLGYVHVMKEGRFKLSGYVDAVMYVAQKLMGKSNARAYAAVFPDKVNRWQGRGVAAKDIASYVSAYHKSKLVGLIMEQTLTPFWVMNQDVYQRAINTQVELMTTALSEKVRTDAANSLLTHLKPPETRKIELDIGLKKDSTIEALRASTQALVERQRQMLAAGQIDAETLAHIPLVIEHESASDRDQGRDEVGRQGEHPGGEPAPSPRRHAE